MLDQIRALSWFSQAHQPPELAALRKLMRNMWELDSEGIEERVAFRAQVRDLVWRETKRRMSFLGFSEQEGPATPNALAPTSAAAKAVHLTYLEVATEVGNAARELAADAATRAGRAAATYADLGEAAGITRQAARKRWPEAVGTHWALYLLTGKNRPHGMTTQVFRSSGKATETGRTAVDEGALADNGAVGAVVINSAREAVWAQGGRVPPWTVGGGTAKGLRGGADERPARPAAGEAGHGLESRG